MGKRIVRRILTSLLGVLIAFALSVPAAAGEWRENGRGWWYDNLDGTYARDGWLWIDGNHDGIAECYCFDGDGYLYVNTRTPDGYYVNLSGQWVVDGVVQTQGSDPDEGYNYNAASRIYSWMNGVYRAEDGRSITLDAAGGNQMSAALYCYSEDGWNTSYMSGQVDENTHSIVIYYHNYVTGEVMGFYRLSIDGEATQIYVQTYDAAGNYVGSWYDGMYYR